MTTLQIEIEDTRPVEAVCDANYLTVTLHDGRMLRAPLWWYPRLQRANAHRAQPHRIFPAWPPLAGSRRGHQRREHFARRSARREIARRLVVVPRSENETHPLLAQRPSRHQGLAGRDRRDADAHRPRGRTRRRPGGAAQRLSSSRASSRRSRIRTPTACASAWSTPAASRRCRSCAARPMRAPA